MTTTRPIDDDVAFAQAFEQAFQRIYLRFHHRNGKHAQMSAVSRAVLLHLTHSGPLTIGEMTAHLDRAQSVVSDLVSQLESNGLLARHRDPADRRRALVWLTDAGRDAVDREMRVLSVDLIAQAAAGMTAARRADLLTAVHDLLTASGTSPDPHHQKGHHR